MNQQTDKLKAEWVPEPKSANKRTAQGWRAIYVRTERGYAVYVIKTPSGAHYGRGGLPEWLPAVPPY